MAGRRYWERLTGGCVPKATNKIKGDQARTQTQSPQAMNALRHGVRSFQFREAMRAAKKLTSAFEETLKKTTSTK